MKIIKTQVLRGPNTWSALHSRLIILTVHTEILSSASYNSAEFLNRVKVLFPAIVTSAELPEIIVAILQELYVQSGMGSVFTKIETRDAETLKIIFGYTSEEAGLYAGEAAIGLVKDLMDNLKPALPDIVDELHYLSKRYELGATSAYILGEAEKRGIPFRRFQHTSLFTLGHGSKQRLIRTAVTDSTSGLGMEVAGDKDETKQLLASANVPVPKGILVDSEEELKESISAVKFPLVTKPLDGNQGRGVTTHINSLEQALFGYNIAKKISDTVIIEEFVEGEDYRFLVINYKLIAVTRRTPAMIVGNGKLTIQQLIDITNLDPARGHGSEHVLAPIKVDQITQKVLRDKGLTLQTVLPDQEILYLKETANISAGGTATDVTDEVHPYTAFAAERIARLFKLNVCGIDIMMKDVRQPLSRDNGAIIEVNAGPGIRMHTNPQKGTARNVAAPIMDMLFPIPQSWRIPVVTVLNNALLTRLLAHLAKMAGYKPGYTASDGMYVQDHRIAEGDFTKTEGANDLLFDPTIDFAILDCQEESVLETGLGFESCDVSVLTGASGKDPSSGADSLQASRLMGRTAALEGYILLSTNDAAGYPLYNDMPARVALISEMAGNAHVAEHVQKGGLAAVLEEETIVIYDGQKITVERLENIPFMQANKISTDATTVLSAVLTAYLCKFALSDIQVGLRSFVVN